MKRFLYYLLPVRLRYFFRRLYFLPIDLFESLTGNRPESVPSRGKIFIGYGDYVKVGERYLEHFKTLCDLSPDHAVLDVGCGIGRMAVPLTKYLSANGTYDGFDIVKNGIDWCKKHISSKYPNFRFHYVGLFNQLYNTTDKTDAANFKFPFENQSFDFVFLTSVFTHMMPAEVENYIHEISRIMRSGSTCFMTFFLINCESEDLMLTRPTHMNFPLNKGFYRLHSTQVETANVAYDEEWLFEKLGNAGLQLKRVEYGQWCGRENYFDYQDIVICTKP